MCVTTKPVYSVDEDSFFFQPTLVPYQSECLRDGCSNKQWITKQIASMLLLNSYFINFNLVGFFNSRKRRWSLIPFWRKLPEGDWSMMSSLHWSVFIDLSVMICRHCFKFVSSLLWRVPLSVIINLKSVLICNQTFRSPKNNTDRRRHFFQQL